MSLKAILICFAAASLGFTAAARAGVDSNSVPLAFEDLTVSSVTYISNSLAVSPGEEYYSPPTITNSGTGSNTVWTITVLANRNKTSPIATDFINDSDGNVWSPYSDVDTAPSALNFVFGVTVDLTVGGEPSNLSLYLGQGSTYDPFEENNWWIGTPGLTISPGKAILSVNGTELLFGAYNGGFLLHQRLGQAGQSPSRRAAPYSWPVSRRLSGSGAHAEAAVNASWHSIPGPPAAHSRGLAGVEAVGCKQGRGRRLDIGHPFGTTSGTVTSEDE